MKQSGISELLFKSVRINVMDKKRKQSQAAGEGQVLLTLQISKRTTSGYCYRVHAI